MSQQYSLPYRYMHYDVHGGRLACRGQAGYEISTYEHKHPGSFGNLARCSHLKAP